MIRSKNHLRLLLVLLFGVCASVVEGQSVGRGPYGGNAVSQPPVPVLPPYGHPPGPVGPPRPAGPPRPVWPPQWPSHPWPPVPPMGYPGYPLPNVSVLYDLNQGYATGMPPTRSRASLMYYDNDTSQTTTIYSSSGIVQQPIVSPPGTTQAPLKPGAVMQDGAVVTSVGPAVDQPVPSNQPSTTQSNSTLELIPPPAPQK